MPTNDRRRRDADEKFESRQLLARADAVIVLADHRLDRLERAAAIYRQRLEGTRESQ